MSGYVRSVAGFSNRQGKRGGHPGGRPAGPGRGAPQPGQRPGYAGQPGYPGQPQHHGPGLPGAGPSGTGRPATGHDDAPGHTRAFTLGEPAPLADRAAYGGPRYDGQGYDGQGYGDRGYEGQGYDGQGYEGQRYDGRPYAHGGGDGQDGYGGQDGYDNVATYRAGQSSAPPAGPRLHWKELLRGIVAHPGRTFWQMRDHTVWGPALTVTFLYGLLAVFGFDAARSDVLSATLATSIPWVLTTGVAVVLCGITLGAVTNTLARQLGGDGAWAPTIGLAMLITTLTDTPRLLFALFLGGGNGFVQLLGWATWLACAALLTSMVSKSHDLPWHKALGASSIQLVALLMLFKLPLI
jgi:hypothetical protein